MNDTYTIFILVGDNGWRQRWYIDAPSEGTVGSRERRWRRVALGADLPCTERDPCSERQGDRDAPMVRHVQAVHVVHWL